MSDLPSKETAINCREAGPGRCLCVECANGHYERCLYVSRPSKQKLSCPFCGHRDIRSHHRGHPTSGEWVIECHSCSCELTGFASEQDAWKTWNGRWNQTQDETSREVEPDLYRDLQRALSDLSMVMGNPCVEIPDNGHLETALIDEATRRLRPEEPTAKHDDKDIRMFLGWLAVELPELHNIETPRLGAAWEKWRALMDDLPLETEAFTPSQIGQIVADNCEPCDERCEHSPEKASGCTGCNSTPCVCAELRSAQNGDGKQT